MVVGERLSDFATQAEESEEVMNAGWMALEGLEGLSEARLLVTTRTTDSDRDLRVDADPPEGTEKQNGTVASSSTAAETSSQMTVETVEVAHEELLRRWDTLKAWANKDRRFFAVAKSSDAVAGRISAG
jgi:hypothetical protein